MATALTATSVGITVRALRELGHSERRSVRIILAAAVLDDVLGLIVLVVVSGTTSGSFDVFNLALLIVEAIAYVGLFGFFGPRLVVRLRDWLKDLNVSILFEIGVVLTLALSLLADYIGLAAIVGAFIAGLTMSELKQHTGIVKRFEPLAWFFTPFFFVLMGTYLDFGAFAQPLGAAGGRRVHGARGRDQVLRRVVRRARRGPADRARGGRGHDAARRGGHRRRRLRPRGGRDRRRRLRGDPRDGAGDDDPGAVPHQGGVRAGLDA